MLRFVDSHLHFWDPARLRYAWLDGLPALNRPARPSDLAWRGADWALAGLVFVQADCTAAQGEAEAAWVSALAEAEPRILGIVAFAPLELGAAARPALEALRRYPLVKGIRRLIQSEGPGFALQPGFVAGVRLLAEFGLTCDLCVRHHQLAEAVQLVRQCPEVRFVLDHLGKPDIRGAQPDPWRRHLAELAACENVTAKLSGVATEADWQAWRPEDLQPYIDHALAVFGPGRLMFGSDHPVVTLASSYARWLATARAAVAGLSPAEQAQVFVTNCVAFYGLELPKDEPQ